jgi:hypothetical protein
LRTIACEGEEIEHDAEDGVADEVLHRVDVAREAHDHVARLAALIERQRLALHVVIEQMAQVEADALANRRRQIFLREGRDRPEDRNRDDRERR